MTTSGRISRVAVGAAVFLAVISFGYAAYLMLGVVTGVLAICAWAPEWWAFTYLLLGLSLPIFAVWAGIRVAKHQRSSPPERPYPGERDSQL